MKKDQNHKTYWLVGGGTAGHISPLLAVGHELKSRQESCQLIYVGERGGRFTFIARNADVFDGYRSVWAGKFRRYHGESFLTTIKDFRTIWLNLIDLFKLTIGLMEAFFVVGIRRPDAIFIKGGFVGVPIGLAAAFWRVPYMTHDSDALPGLANRIVSRWAKIHAVGMPKELYKYDQDKTFFTGVPIQAIFNKPPSRFEARKRLGVSKDAVLLFVTGASNGAVTMSKMVRKALEKASVRARGLEIIHQVGSGNIVESSLTKYKQIEFTDRMIDYFVASDVVVARAGATNMAELAAVGRAAILIPNPLLAGGHQSLNARAFSEGGYGLVVGEGRVVDLENALKTLLSSQEQRKHYARKIKELARPHAAQTIAELLLGLSK